MSKLAFTIVLPHDKTDGNRTPSFFVSSSNYTHFNVKGTNFRGGRWGNGNVDSGWKNRFEYAVTAAKGVTKLSIMMNTSIVLPPVSWNLATLEIPSKSKEKVRSKDSHRSRASSNSSSKGSERKHHSREKTSSRRDERSTDRPRRRESSTPRPQIEERDQQHDRPRKHRKHRSKSHANTGYLDAFDVNDPFD